MPDKVGRIIFWPPLPHLYPFTQENDKNLLGKIEKLEKRIEQLERALGVKDES